MTPTPEVSERARALRAKVAVRLLAEDCRCATLNGMVENVGMYAEAIVTELGITQEMLERLRRLERFAEAAEEWDHRDTASDAVDFAATLLAVGGSDD